MENIPFIKIGLNFKNKKRASQMYEKLIKFFFNSSDNKICKIKVKSSKKRS